MVPAYKQLWLVGVLGALVMAISCEALRIVFPWPNLDRPESQLLSVGLVSCWAATGIVLLARRSTGVTAWIASLVTLATMVAHAVGVWILSRSFGGLPYLLLALWFGYSLRELRRTSGEAALAPAS